MNIININEFIADFENKSIAECRVIIDQVEDLIVASIKKKDLITAYQYTKLKAKLHLLLSKKISNVKSQNHNNKSRSKK